VQASRAKALAGFRIASPLNDKKETPGPRCWGMSTSFFFLAIMFAACLPLILIMKKAPKAKVAGGDGALGARSSTYGPSIHPHHRDLLLSPFTLEEKATCFY
jgi:hypothetical protein